MPTEQIFLAETAWSALKRLETGARDYTVGNDIADDAMLKIFFNSNWVNVSDAPAGNSNTQGRVKRYAITKNGLRILSECEVVPDTDPRAVGLNPLYVQGRALGGGIREEATGRLAWLFRLFRGTRG
jgi:hypothetical protein